MEDSTVLVNMPDGTLEEREVVIWEHEGELLIKEKNK